MEAPLKQRLIGAIVLAALALIFVPMLLRSPDVRDPDSADVSLNIPDEPDADGIKTIDIPLDQPAAASPAELPELPEPEPIAVADDAAVAAALEQAGAEVRDPVWRLPFWTPYEPMIEPGIADLDNAPPDGMAGSITAALFLRRFVDCPRYLHFDLYCHQKADAPARPKGGVGQGARAVLAALPAVLGL